MSAENVRKGDRRGVRVLRQEAVTMPISIAMSWGRTANSLMPAGCRAASQGRPPRRV